MALEENMAQGGGEEETDVGDKRPVTAVAQVDMGQDFFRYESFGSL